MARKKLANLREDYSKKELDISDVLDNPLKQFETWIKEALQSKVPEPNAMTLSTVSPDGIPSARIVLLKKLSEKGFTFFTNYNSQKGKEMAKNKNVSLTFVWLELERQVRIEGVVKKVSKKASKKYFQSRPKKSQMGAWVSSQSKVIKNREVLEKSMKDLEERFKDEEVLPCPPNWGGYLVQPVLIEFWQGRRSRLHDRIRYKLTKKGKWKKERLAP
ncbi:MAG: pyridoxamine 5'-phosphate oxidase [Saprospiraceae bacterium]|nr:pyridoxamine 5'-phosphate oxidase [Saprospiraceae bacterium]